MHATSNPGRYTRLLGALEEAKRLDAAVTAAEPLAARLMAQRKVRTIVRGDTTGIPLHTILTDGPFGAWWSAVFLDLFDDEASRRSSQRLVALGVVAAVPTALSGWATWSGKDRPLKRVGVVHAAANAAATAVYVASWRARSRGNHRAGVRLARMGAVLLLVSGFLGGHLSSGRHASRQGVVHG
ncbi:hypothetical protein J2S98_002082 [Arthrobacter oryzae]|uniref:DUF2231 domain-containing protein n=1 Tax=Arthrobacter TaxID=1663 RepID=UPI001F19E9EF|nr:MULTISPECIES: DUF2231 domain-containing protein [Arthrobacter]MDP9986924.1 hypothetical protein [Arthrobacter oryzae]UKA70815.1 hypothetical protein LFT49_19170 [Arthrobacter sp. FW306-06-A]